jgi:hypothetical protein
MEELGEISFKLSLINGFLLEFVEEINSRLIIARGVKKTMLAAY